VVHTGDIVADPDPKAFELAHSLFSKLPCPFYVVNGNHDSAEGLRATFAHAQVPFPFNTHTYRFETRGCSFLVLDGNTNTELAGQGLLGNQQLNWVETQLQSINKAAIFVHYPAFSLDCDWTDRLMLLKDGERLHNILELRRDQIGGVFFGHIHSGMQLMRDGILYSSVASPAFRFPLNPPQAAIEFYTDTPITYSIVTLSNNRTIVKEQLVLNNF
jgi:DNA repair exonuclease SbcCD nuclease subunit